MAWSGSRGSAAVVADGCVTVGWWPGEEEEDDFALLAAAAMSAAWPDALADLRPRLPAIILAGTALRRLDELRPLSNLAPALWRKVEALARRADDLAARRGQPVAAIAAAIEAHRLAAEMVCSTVPSREHEWRAVWLFDWQIGKIAPVAASLRRYGFNVIVLGGDYDAASLAAAADPAAERLLSSTCRAARKAGLWPLVALNALRTRLPADDLARLKLRAMQDEAGRPVVAQGWTWLCPRSPGLAGAVGAALEKLRGWGAAGVVLNSLAYPNTACCFCPACRGAFEKTAGRPLSDPRSCKPGGGDWPQWSRARAEALTELLRAVRQRARGLLIAVLTPALPQQAGTAGQDWGAWSRQRLVNVLMPSMNIGANRPWTIELMGKQLSAVGGRIDIVPLLGSTCHRESLGTPPATASQIHLVRELGAAGFAVYRWGERLEAALPALMAGPLKQPARPPICPENVTITFSWREADFNPPLPARTFPLALPPQVTVSVKLAPDAKFRGAVQVAPAGGGEAVASKAVPPSGGRVAVRLPAQVGVWVVEVEGAVERGRHREEAFARSLPLRILDEGRLRALTRMRRPSPRRVISVGVLAGRGGSGALLAALGAQRSIKPAPLWRLDEAGDVEVLVVPGPAGGEAADDSAALRSLAGEQGKGVILLGAAVGTNPEKAPFPELFAGRALVPDQFVRVKMRHTLAAGLPDSFSHTALGHLSLQVGPAAAVVLVDAAGRPVVACGQHGRGRVVAIGFPLGSSLGGGPAPLSPPELRLLRNAIMWAAPPPPGRR